MSFERGKYVQDYELNSRTGSVNRKIDRIRSNYPRAITTSAVGYASWTDSRVVKSIITPPSGHIFHVRKITLANNGAAMNIVRLYDVGASASTPCFPDIYVAGSGTVYLGENEVEGYIWQSTMVASVLDSYIQIRVQGWLIASDQG